MPGNVPLRPIERVEYAKVGHSLGVGALETLADFGPLDAVRDRSRGGGSSRWQTAVGRYQTSCNIRFLMCIGSFLDVHWAVSDVSSLQQLVVVDGGNQIATQAIPAATVAIAARQNPENL